MEPHELEELGVPALGEQVEAAGLDWYHVPITDGSIPGPRAEAIWHYVGARVRRLLMADQAVVIHCKGGLGRTGTLAARVLIERGSDPATAIEQVRATRKGTIENDFQLEYVRGLGSEVHLDLDRRERTLASLLGGAVGDGFGYAVEFDRLDAIRRQHGPAGLQVPVYENGRLLVSDDTQMTMFTLEGILQHGQSVGAGDRAKLVDAIYQAYLRWLRTQEHAKFTHAPDHDDLASQPVMRVQRAPGNTCLGALRSGKMGTPTHPINDSKGCGGVMRVAPLGLLSWLSPHEAFEEAIRAAAITHGHPSGYLSAGALAAMLRMMIDGESLLAANDAAIRLLEGQSKAWETIDCLRRAQELAQVMGTPAKALLAQLGEGWVGEEALAIGLFAALRGTTFREVIAIATNHSGDSDSTASIAAQLYGACHGLDGLPHAWVRRLDVLEPLLRLCHELATARTGG